MFKVDEIIKACAGKLIQGSSKDKLVGISTDTRTIKPKEAFLALKGSNFNGHNFIAESLRLKASCLILEKTPSGLIPKGIAVIRVKDTTLALGDIARYQRQKFLLPVIAITGSNGKTTTKEMISWVLSSSGQVLKNPGTQNNHIGLPQALIKLCEKDDFAVLEIGTNHFGEVKYLAEIARPNIGLITNIASGHLEFFKNQKGVFKEKSTLLDCLQMPGIAVLNADDKLLNGLIARKNKEARIFTYGIKEKSDFQAREIKLQNTQVEFKVNRKYKFRLSTLGCYNVYNALGAIALGRIFGLSYFEISNRLSSFKFPRGRLNLVEFNGFRFIDDTYNSNPLSLQAALDTLGAARCRGKKILIMGDMLELGRQKELLHRQISRSITKVCDVLVAVGSLARLTAQAAEASGFSRKKIFYCDTSLEARDLLFNRIFPDSRSLILVKGSRLMKMEEVFKV